MRRFALPLTLALALASTSARAEYRDLCSSVPAACEYSGPDAPTLAAAVCWSTEVGAVLKGETDCPPGSWAYFARHGEILDPLSGAVQAYVPLDDACDHGVCVQGPPPDGGHEQAICCEWGLCVPLEQVPCNSEYSTILFCIDGVTNADGTVTCFEGQG